MVLKKEQVIEILEKLSKIEDIIKELKTLGADINFLIKLIK